MDVQLDIQWTLKQDASMEAVRQLLADKAHETRATALSRHETREAADAALAQVMQHGVRTAKVAPLPAPAQHWLRAARADLELQTRLKALRPPAIAAEFGPCAKRGGA